MVPPDADDEELESTVEQEDLSDPTTPPSQMYIDLEDLSTTTESIQQKCLNIFPIKSVRDMETLDRRLESDIFYAEVVRHISNVVKVLFF